MFENFQQITSVVSVGNSTRGGNSALLQANNVSGAAEDSGMRPPNRGERTFPFSDEKIVTIQITCPDNPHK